MTNNCKRSSVLVTNDDGIHAPGLRALVAAIHKADFCDLLVCAPSGERSAQSHALTVGKPLLSFPVPLEGAHKSFAVDGTPADSVLVALHSPLIKEHPETDPTAVADVVVSGINRGDNCGLHVTYSGTVGAAREAACKGVPAIALSLDGHAAGKTLAGYEAAARCSIVLIQAALGLLPGHTPRREDLEGGVLNVNFPSCAFPDIRGFYMTHQSGSCMYPSFTEVDIESQASSGIDKISVVEITFPDGREPEKRAFRNFAGEMKWDKTPGSDTWALLHNWVSVTPLALRQDIRFRQDETSLEKVEVTLPRSLAGILTAAAEHMRLSVGGLPKLECRT